MALQPTAQFLRDLDDATKYVCVPGVPVFKAHTRILPEYRDPTGKLWPEIRINVTDDDLSAIAYETNRSGPQPMTEGHRNPDPKFPESQQPRVVGWERNHRMGTFTSDGKTYEKCVVADLCYRADLFRHVGPGRYPFRSIDYDFNQKKITGLALLVRRPFLDLGALPYSRPFPVVSYSMDANPMTPEEKRLADLVMARLLELYPHLAEPLGAAPAEPIAAAIPASGTTGGLYYPKVEQTTPPPGFPVGLGRAIADAPGNNLPHHRQETAAGRWVRLNPKTPTVEQAVALDIGNYLGYQAEGGMGRAQMEAATQYASANGVPWEVARNWAMANVRGDLPSPEEVATRGVKEAGQPKPLAAGGALTQQQMNAAVLYADAQKVPFETARQWALTNA